MLSAAGSIGTRLTLIISLVFGLYLVSASVIGYVMYQQYQEFRQLAGEHFEQALKAAELTRNAEVIAAEVFEVMVSGERSLSVGNQRTENLRQLYKASREQLDETGLASHAMQQELDRWQNPFFQSLDALDARLTHEKDLQRDHLVRMDQLFLILRQWPESADWLNLPPQQQAFYSASTLAVSYAGAALSAERPGQVAQLHDRVQSVLADIAAMQLVDDDLREQRAQLLPLLDHMLMAHTDELQSERSTLAQARQTRVLAQKLTGASYNYHVELKLVAQDAIAKHQGLIRQSLIGLLIAAVLLFGVTALAIAYVRRTVVARIDLLNRAMQAHLEGRKVSIPIEGQDEIAAMGTTFAFFVQARQQAEQRLAKANDELQVMNDELAKISVTDGLTGIANRRCFEQRLDAEWNRARREGQLLGVIMADVDRFKAFNDTYGHQQGDTCLHQVAQAMSACLHRSSDLVARYGGEEFIMLLPGLDAEQTEQLAMKILEAVRALNIPHSEAPAGVVTLSLGVACLLPDASTHPDRLIGLADNALYAAKAGGRNQVHVAD